MPSARLALAGLAALAVATSARGEEGEGTEVDGHAVLHTRLTSRRDLPRTEVLYDVPSRTFEVGRYLRPLDDDGFASTFLRLGLAGRRRDLRFELTADSGEVRRLAVPYAVEVCASSSLATPPGQPGSPTGLDLRGGQYPCNRATPPGLPPDPPPLAPGAWFVPENVLAPKEWVANGRPLGTEARATWFIREAWVGGNAGANGFAFWRAGRHRFAIADGFVYDDYGLGIEGRLDLGAVGPPWDLGAALFWPTRDWPGGGERRSPMAVLRADRLLSLFDHVGLFAAFFHDRTGGIAELFRGAAVESSAVRLQGLVEGSTEYQIEAQRLAHALDRTLAGSADLLWLGASGSLAPLRWHRFSFTASLATGHVSMQLGTDGTVIGSRVLGGMAQADWSARVHPDVALGARLLWISGDVPPPERSRVGLPARYGGFIGVAPWITATNLFFAGGLSETFAARQASAPGVNGRGVAGPILRAAYEPGTALRAEVKGAWFAATAVGPYGGRVYGPEVDLNVRWAALRWLALSAEADVLWPGDFFGGGGPMRKVIVGIDLTAP